MDIKVDTGVSYAYFSIIRENGFDGAFNENLILLVCTSVVFLNG